MPMMKNVLGLDLGSHSIKAVELRQTLRGLEPGQLRVQPRNEGEPLAESIHHLAKLHHLPSEHVVCALPGDRISNRRLEFPFRDKKKLSQAVPFEVEGEIPFALDDVIVDWQLTSGDRNHGVVTATVAQREDVSRFLAEIDESGLPPRILEAEGLALANLLSIFDLPDTGIIVDIGHRKTTLCLVIDRQPIAARTIPAAGGALTRALAQDLGTSLEEAEERKCDQGLFDANGSAISPGAQGVLDRIAREILRTFESHEHAWGGGLAEAAAGLTLVGGSARLPGLESFFASRLGVPVRCLSAPDGEEHAALVAGGDPVLFGPAIALALRATARTVTKMNFRQDEFTYRTDLTQLFRGEMRPTAIMAAIVFLLFAASTTTSIALESRKAGVLERQAGQLYQEIFPGAEAPERPMAALSQAVGAARERADFLGLYQGNQSALDLMNTLSERVPKDLNVRFEEVNIDRKVVRIKVGAENYEAMDRLENRLKSAPPFEQADVSGQAKRLKDGSVTFSVSVPLEAEETDR